MSAQWLPTGHRKEFFSSLEIQRRRQQYEYSVVSPPEKQTIHIVMSREDSLCHLYALDRRNSGKRVWPRIIFVFVPGMYYEESETMRKIKWLFSFQYINLLPYIRSQSTKFIKFFDFPVEMIACSVGVWSVHELQRTRAYFGQLTVIRQVK
jgi:hypothetical protein